MIRAWVGGLLWPCALAWAIWSASPNNLRQDHWPLLVAFGAPILVIFWGVVAPSRYRGPALTWLRAGLVLHALSMLALHFEAIWFLVSDIALVVDILALAAMPGGRSHSAVDRFAQVVRWSMAGWCVAGLGILAFGIGLVEWRAERAANDQPYCILVPSNREPELYAEASSLYDISFFRMRSNVYTKDSSSGPAFHHGRMLVDGKLDFLHWSYWSLDLEETPPGVYYLVGTCEARAHFVRHLRWLL